MWISEVFHSIQGEGQFVGVPSTFIRTSGCNLRCSFCDTRYSSWEPEGSEWSIESLLQEVQDHGHEHVVLTGGEPLLVPDVVPLTNELKRLGRIITIETAGTIFRPVAADLMSISPKRTNSTPWGTNWEARHEQRRHRPEVLRQLLAGYRYQLKFVIDKPADVTDIDEYLLEFPEVLPENIYLMPQGTDVESLKSREVWLAPLAKSRGWKITPRLHVELFGNTRGT
jgi:7-carboxy-7-deazaguanine synthase